MNRRFNPRGQTIEMTDALGQSSRIERNLVTGLPTSTIGPCGCGEATREFDARGNITAITDRLGQTTRMKYEPILNRLVKVTDKLGRITLMAYDSRGNLVSVTDALNQVSTLGYDQYGQLISVTDPLGHTRRLEYDSQGNTTAMIDAINHALREEMASNPKIQLWGEDVADPKGGVFGVTRGLTGAFPGRVFNSPLAEASIAGVAGGMAIAGYKPIVEMQFGDYLWPAAQQLRA